MPLVIVLLLLFIFLESTVIAIPLALIFLICLSVIQKNRLILLLGFFTGLLLDLLLIRTFGATAMIMVVVLFLLMLYQKKVEIATYYFAIIASFLAALSYLLLFHVPHAFLYAAFCGLLAILFFWLLLRVFVKKEKAMGTFSRD